MDHRSNQCSVHLVSLALILAVILVLPISRETAAGETDHNITNFQLNTIPRPATVPSGTFFDHLVFIIMENEGIDNICGSGVPPCQGSNSPYMSGLANSYGLALQYLSLVGTSQPNYVGIMAASVQNCTSSCGSGTLHAINLVDRLESAGLTWKGYMENQTPSNGCDNSDHAPYEAAHNPFVPFNDIDTSLTRCNNIKLANPSSCGSVTDCSLVNDLNGAAAPNFMWLTPNDCNNMHATSGCSNGCTSPGSNCIKAGDNYLSSLVPNILSSSTFQNARSALFISFDEGQGFCPGHFPSGEDCMYSAWTGLGAKTGFTSGTKYNHYSFTKTIETNWNLPTITANDAGATAMSEFFKPPAADFSISATPTTTTAIVGAKSNYTITLSSLNGYVGTVSLAATCSPTGPSMKLTPSSISLSSGVSANSILTVTSMTAGNFTITVKGVSGSLSHSTGISLIVNASLPVGGAIVPSDKLGLLLPYVAATMLTVFFLSMCSAWLRTSKSLGSKISRSASILLKLD